MRLHSGLGAWHPPSSPTAHAKGMRTPKLTYQRPENGEQVTAGVIVTCSEEDPAADIQPDCAGMPALHLFLIAMSRLKLRAIIHFVTTQT